MIEDPEFPETQSLEHILTTTMRATVEEICVMDGDCGIEPIEGLALIESGLNRAAVDIPNYGRTVVWHPRPSLVALKAEPTGYKKVIIP